MHDFHTKHDCHDDKYESRKNILHKSTIKINKKLKIYLMKITESSVEGMIKEHNKAGNKKQEAQGPQFAHLPIVLMENC